MEAFRFVAGKSAAAGRDRPLRHVDTYVARISGDGQLGAVPAAKFDDGSNSHFLNKTIYNVCFEFREAAEGTGPGGASLPVAILPIGGGTSEPESTPKIFDNRDPYERARGCAE
jgi:hypothetical protein